MNPHFPFVVVLQYDSAKSLQREKPLLLSAILAAATHDNCALQRRLGDEFKQAVMHRVLCAGPMSLELLQALLVYLAW